MKTASQQTTTRPIVAIVANRRALRAELADLRVRHASLIEESRGAEHVLNTLGSRLDTRALALADRAAAEQTTVDNLGGEEYAALKMGVKEAQHDVQGKRAALERTEERISSIERELDAFPASGELTAVRDLQEVIAERRADLERFESALAECRMLVDHASAPGQMCESLQRMREDVLAKMATGEATAEDLADLDGRITHAEAAAKLAATRKQEAESTARGLERGIRGAQAQIDELEDSRRDLLERLIDGEIQRMGEEYFVIASELVDIMTRMAGLQHLAVRHTDSHRTYLNLSTIELALPRPGVRAVEGKRFAVRPGALFDNRVLNPDRVRDAEVAERARLIDLGVTL